MTPDELRKHAQKVQREMATVVHDAPICIVVDTEAWKSARLLAEYVIKEQDRILKEIFVEESDD